MLEIKDLTVSYRKHLVLDHLNISFETGKVHGLVGENGAGKTTFLNALYGFKDKEHGEILFNSKALQKKSVAFLETDNFFYPKITGREYLKLFLSRNPKFDIKGWNDIMELPLDTYIETYSTGMKKKLALLGIISLNKEILILDEPFRGLDLETNQILYEILVMLAKRGKTLLITSHLLESLTHICDQIHLLYQKKIQESFGRENFSGILKSEFFKKSNIKLELARKLINEQSGNN